MSQGTQLFTNTNALHGLLHEIKIPIFRPFKPVVNSIAPVLSNLTSKATISTIKEIVKFSNWVISYVPEPIKNVVNERVESLKERIKQIFHKPDKFTPKEWETALAGYLKTYRINGQAGYGPISFTSRYQTQVSGSH